MYRRLLARFGPQGWWPVRPAGARRAVYKREFTRRGLAPAQIFEMAVGAFLTQNTAWTNVSRALDNLAEAGALSPEKLARLLRRRLEKLIRPSGYFRQKADRVARFARFLLERWDGQLERFLDRPTTIVRQELLALHGVGPETADSILLYAGRHPVFVVDAYTRRAARRLGLIKTDDYGEVQRFFMTHIKPSLPVYREFHALIVALAKDHCRVRPDCSPCPLRSGCPAAPASR